MLYLLVILSFFLKKYQNYLKNKKLKNPDCYGTNPDFYGSSPDFYGPSPDCYGSSPEKKW